MNKKQKKARERAVSEAQQMNYERGDPHIRQVNHLAQQKRAQIERDAIAAKREAIREALRKKEDEKNNWRWKQTWEELQMEQDTWRHSWEQERLAAEARLRDMPIHEHAGSW